MKQRMADLKYVLARLVGNPPREDPFGMVAEFEDPTALLHAAREIRRAGYRHFDAHSPFPIHGIERAMGARGSLVPWVVLGGGATGCLGGLALQVWINVFDYPLVISGKPHFALPAYIPVTFELTVLLAAFGALGGMLLLNLLPMLYHPLFKARRFARATSDGFFISVEARDPKFDVEATRRLLEDCVGRHITVLEP